MALNLNHYGEHDQNIFTLPDPADFDQGLIFGEKYFVLIGKLDGLITILNQEWGVGPIGDRRVAQFKWNPNREQYTALNFQADARDFERHVFKKQANLVFVLDKARSIAITEWNSYQQNNSEGNTESKVNVDGEWKSTINRNLPNPDKLLPAIYKFASAVDADENTVLTDTGGVVVRDVNDISGTFSYAGSSYQIKFVLDNECKFKTNPEVFNSNGDRIGIYVPEDMFAAGWTADISDPNWDDMVEILISDVLDPLVEAQCAKIKEKLEETDNDEDVTITVGGVDEDPSTDVEEEKIGSGQVLDANDEELREILKQVYGENKLDGSPQEPTAQQLSAYRQLIEDGPQGKEWDRLIAALQKMHPSLQNVDRITDAELNAMSYEEQWAIRARRSEFRIGNGNLGRGSSLDQFSMTSRMEMVLADPCKNNFFSNVSSFLNKFITRITGGMNNILGKANSVLNFANELSDTASTILGTAKSFVSQMGDFLQTKIQTFIKMGLQKMATFLFATSFTPIDGLLKVIALNVSAVNPVGFLMKILGCVTSKVADVLHGVIEDMLVNMVGQVVNGVTCAVEQFVGGITNKITSVMDSIVGPFIRPVEMLFKLIGFGFGSIKGLLGKGFNIMNQIGNLLKCGSNKFDVGKCPGSKYIIDQGTAPEKSADEQQSIINRVFDKGSEKLAGIQDKANKFKDGVGDWEIFGSKVSEGKNVQRCNTSADIFKCGAPKIEFIGGDGEGAVGKVLLGKVMNKFDPDNLLRDISQTASIIGVEMQYPGEGYTTAPIVAFTDSCDQGYGAYGRAVIGQDRTKPTFGQITDIIIISEGVNYPAGDDEEVYVDKVIVEDGGLGYSMDDNMDDFDICGVDANGSITSICPNNKAYRSLPQLNITSKKGSGAILRPIMTTKRRDTAVQMEIDCVTT